MTKSRNIWLISDTHFSHKNIINFTYGPDQKYVRPNPNTGHRFLTIQEHDQMLIENWNETIKDGDKVYHLGDVAMNPKRLEGIMPQLNGSKRLILGNHDVGHIKLYQEYFKKILGSREFNGVVMTHVPVHVSQLDRWRGNIHGHIHEKIIFDGRYLNICVEHTEMRPIHIEDALSKLE